MTNDTIIKKILKDDFTNFCNNITTGLEKPDKKFVSSILFGLLSGESVLLTNIARELNETITINKTVERLSRGLKRFDKSLMIRDNYVKQISDMVNDESLFIVDDSEIIKPLGEKFECLGQVADGSNEHKIEKGYHINEIALLNSNKHPISVSSLLWSEKEKGFISTNDILEKSIIRNVNRFGNKGTYIFDRGFDSNKIMDFLMKNELTFIVRLKSNRKVIHNKNKKSINNVISSCKGKVNFKVFYNGQVVNCKISHTKVRFLGFNNDLTLVVIHGFGNTPITLITNRVISSKSSVDKIVRDYFSRWRIEEFFKFKKQQFDFENIRVRSLKGIRLMNDLLTIAIGFIGLTDQYNFILSRLLIKVGKSLRNDVLFLYYQIQYGIKKIINRIVDRFSDLFICIRIRKKRERNLFTSVGIFRY